MPRVEVDVSADHLQQLARGRGPVLSLAELIWNALDADATEVEVAIERSLFGTVQAVEVRDNGTGISPTDALRGFGRLGGSWKKLTYATRRDGRVLHGKEGKGRFNAFSIGQDVEWVSRSEGVAGKVEELTITAQLDNLRAFDISDAARVVGPTGTTVRVSGVRDGSDVLLKPGVYNQLVEVFALYLRQYPTVRIVFDGRQLDPGQLVVLQRQYPIGMLLVDDEMVDDAVLTIVEWNTPMSRNLYLCDREGFNLHMEKVGVKAPGFDFTAYLRSAYLRRLYDSHELQLGEVHAGLNTLLAAARDEMRGHFRKRAAERASELVDEWKRENVYPYEGEPKSPVERSEREVFDIVALNVNAYLPEFSAGDAKSKRFSLRLLKQGIESNPANMQLILSEVLGLPKQKQDELADLLKKTTLSSIITASKIVADRLDFIRALECLLFDKESKKQLLERTGLHRILVDHTWLFGEEFHLSVDDQNLNEVLAKHVKLLGREILNDEAPVKRDDDTDGVVDLMLSQSIVSHRGQEREHLVVELKRPSQKIDLKVLDQVQSYARAVARDERFRDVATRWTFWAVSNEITEDARFRLEDERFPKGTLMIHKPTGITIMAMTWGEIIQDAKARLQFYQQQLNYTADRATALEALRRTHEKYFPDVLRDEPPAA